MEALKLTGLIASSSVFLLAAVDPDSRMFEYPISAASRPAYVAVGPSFDAWLTDPINDAVWSVSGDGRSVLRYVVTPSRAEPLAVAGAIESSRSINDDPWFTEVGSGKLATIGREGTFKELGQFRMTQSVLTPPPGLKPPVVVSIAPLDVITQADGSVWFTEPTHRRIGKYSGGKLTLYTATTTGAPLMMAFDSHGVLWFTETISGRIAKFQDGAFSEFSDGDAKPKPISLAIGSLTRAMMPARIAVQPGGTVYFTRNWPTAACDSRIGQLDTSGKIRYLRTPTPNAGPADLTIAPDGEVWFTEYCANKIAHITPEGQIIEIDVLTPNSGPLGISGNLDRAVFAESKAGKLGVYRWGVLVPAHGDPATTP